MTLLSASSFGKLDARDGQREMVLPLDGIAGIAVQFQGRRVFVRSDELFAALSGKEA